MSIVQPIIRDQLAIHHDDDWDSVYHVEWEPDANFFTGSELRPRTPLCKATADHQITLARAAALIIRASLNNIPLDIPDFDPSKLTGFRKQLYQWMQTYNASQASKLVLGDVTMAVTIEILSSLTRMGTEGEILAKIGPNLGAILQGTIDPMPLLLEGDRFNRMHNGMELMQKMRVHLGQYLSSYATKKPVLNVLEVGTSTSNNTQVIFDALREQKNVSYTLTDSSLSVPVQTKSGISKDFLKLKSLDIKRDPIEQGFSPNTYDLILVNNILHTANSVPETLANLRKLLVPGGALALVGVSDISPAYSLILGMNENMWPDERCEQLPFPSSDDWNKLLQGNQFSGLEPATKTFDHIGQSCYCVITTAVASTQRLMVNILPGSQGSLFSFADQLASALAENGTASTITPTQLKDISSRFVYVVLDDGSESLSDYETLSEANNILWINMEAGLSTQRDMNIISRFARGARKDNESLKLVKLDVKQEYPEYADLLKVIMRIIQVSFQENRGSRTEFEYEYRNGRVLVPQVKGSGVTQKSV
ncbi:Highly reducing polyketide synthase AFT9-1 [Fusarium oxysporum f. sp. rapae]|uniref:Highly reducing polyketide synthase AFT9-1 n=1 Tax=Fusarium oxysporum f. sp. rapae TaxID=485398 RepID=A0A8J5NTE0_FUSOX|nr:Highly reducing polyketide synthase AFT9-1 [Fusarium oxysporum f. sp. rapae]